MMSAISLSSYGTVMGTRVAWRVCESDIGSRPEWSTPQETPPPLDMQEAIKISYSELPKYFPKVEQWDLEDIWLHSLKPGKWFYVVSWRARGTSGDDLGIPVLMDGQAVALITE